MSSVPFVTNFRLAGSRKRLWMVGGILGAFILTLVVGNHFVRADRSVTRQMLGHDFLAFYTAGSFVREGRARDLYKLDAVRDFEQSTAHAAGLEVGKSFGPWWNPPFYALLFEPLARLSYGQALNLWRWISLLAVIIAIGLLADHVAQASLATRWQQWMLVPVLVVISMPFIQAISHGQNTFTSLFLLTLTAVLWRRQRRFATGIIAGLLFYKPQLGAVVAAVMVLDLGWTALAGLSVTGIILLAITAIAMPGSLGDWLHQLPANVRWMQVEHAYLWERHVTLKAFWRLLLQGREAGEATMLTTFMTWASVALIGGGLARSAISVWFNRRADAGCDAIEQTLRRDRLISATIIAMPLLMPFYFDYDLLLLAIPATFYATERIIDPSRSHAGDRWLTGSWAMLFCWLFVNPAFALHTHVDGTVILLSAVAVQSIQRVNRLEGEMAPMLILRPQRVAMAA